MSMAQLTLIGNVGRDPELSYTPTGVPVTKFSVAVSRKVGDKETTEWYNCTAWRGLAEMLNKSLTKGRQVFVQGDFSTRPYTTRDGKQNVSLDVSITSFQFLGSKPTTGAASGSDLADNDPLGDLEDHPF